jgi:hypothetical protein
MALVTALPGGVSTQAPPAQAYGDGNGTSSTGTVIGTPVPMSQTYNVELKGDYVAAGVGMRGSGPPGAGTIAAPALPGGSTVVKSLLYWSIMQTSPPPGALATATFNGNNIVGTLIGSTGEPCWDPASPPPDFDIHNYVADVTGLEITGGNNSLTNFSSGGPPGDSSAPPILEGASLVVVYSNAATQNHRVQIHEGAISFVMPPTETTMFSGWTAVAGTTRTTYIVADGQSGGAFNLNNRTLIDGTETANHTLNGAGPGTQYWDTLTQDISAFVPAADTSVSVEVESTGNDCITWVAQVLSVPVAEPPTPSPSPTPSPAPSPTVTPVVGGLTDLFGASSGSHGGGSGYAELAVAAAAGLTGVALLTTGGLATVTARRRRRR